MPDGGLGSDAEARRRCEGVIASAGEAIWSGSPAGTIESWNPAAQRLYGYSETEIVGRSAAVLSGPAISRTSLARSRRSELGARCHGRRAPDARTGPWSM